MIAQADKIPASRCRQAASVLLLTALLLVWPGCAARGAAGVITAERLTQMADRLPASLQTALYHHDPKGETWCIISDLAAEEILSGEFASGQFVRIEWLWTPRPGATPMDRDATNVSIRHIVIADGEVGVFEGGGFALPSDRAGRDEWSVELRNATLTLVTATELFRDHLSPARLTGSFTARLEPEQARRVRNAVSQRLTDLLNRSMRADAGVEPMAGGAGRG